MLNKLRILLADDEAILRLDLREMLADAGHKIVGETANGQEAVKLAKELKPDFIIMDVKMPIMDGITAAKIIAADNIAYTYIVIFHFRHILSANINCKIRVDIY